MADFNDTTNVFEAPEPMAPDHFVIAVSHMRLTDENIIEAARRVLVEEQKNSEVEAALGVGQGHLSRTCGNIAAKWKAICAKETLICRPIALPEHEMNLVIALQKQNIEHLKRQKKNRKKPKDNPQTS